MTLREHMTFSLFVGWRFLMGDKKALKFLDTSGRGVLRSFSALLFAAPLFFLIQWLQFRTPGYDWIGIFHYFGLFIGYGLAWVLFAVSIFYAHSIIGPRPIFVRFITAYNWGRVYALLIMFPVFLLSSFGIIEGNLKMVLFWLFGALALSYKYFITRVALEVNIFHGILFVLFDVVLVMLMDALIFVGFGHPIDSPLS